MTQDILSLKHLLLDSTLCSNSLELLLFFSFFFPSHKTLWRMVTMDPLPYIKKNLNSAFLVAASVCCQKLLVIQKVRDYRKYQYSGN